MVKKRMVISGAVQGVGYRALIKQVARNLAIRGTVRNMDDGTVEVFCDATEEAIEKLRGQIDVKGDATNPFAVNVEGVEVFAEGDENYIDAPDVFGLFDVDYGIEMGSFERESLERSEIGGLLLVGTRQDIREMHTDLGEKLDNMDSRLDSVDSRLGTVIQRYDIFGEKMVSLDMSIRELRTDFKRLVDHVVGEGMKSPE